jgi:ribonuclease HII
MTQWIIGIDEAGRSPLAGPVAVGAVLVPTDFDFSLVAGVKDSKQLTAIGREKWFRNINALAKTGLRHAVSFSSASSIDKYGITRAVHRALKSAIMSFGVDPALCDVRLDGLLHAPRACTTQQTIIGGDETEPVISLAAIAAKVTRDRYMLRIARKHRGYGFENHKGYGTKEHYAALASLGLIPLVHRVSHCH